QLPDFAYYLRATILAPEGRDGTWSYDDRRWTLSNHCTNWTLGHLDDFIPPRHDNMFCVFRRESHGEWYIRLESDECHVPHSEGVEMLAVLLQHPETPMSAEKICIAVGIVPNPAERKEPLPELGRTLKLAEEFRPELIRCDVDDLPATIPEL